MVFILCTIIAMLVASPAVLAAGDPSAGEQLFTGAARFENGGAACIACHNVEGVGSLGGGRVGKDLTKAYSRFGEQGLSSILKQPAFPIMKDIFDSRPITPQEQQDLLAFFKDVDQRSESQATAGTFFVIGLVGMVVLLVLFNIFFARRNRGVRRQLVGGAIR